MHINIIHNGNLHAHTHAQIRNTCQISHWYYSSPVQPIVLITELMHPVIKPRAGVLQLEPLVHHGKFHFLHLPSEVRGK